MCKHGETKLCYVPIEAEDSHTGKFRWDWKAVDSCIADLVDTLNKYGILTRSCCCGHGKSKGTIILHSGTTIDLPDNMVTT